MGQRKMPWQQKVLLGRFIGQSSDQGTVVCGESIPDTLTDSFEPASGTTCTLLLCSSQWPWLELVRLAVLKAKSNRHYSCQRLKWPCSWQNCSKACDNQQDNNLSFSAKPCVPANYPEEE